MPLVKEPGVHKSEISVQSEVTMNPLDLNIFMAVDSPSGKSEPEIVRSLTELYQKFGTSAAPSLFDSKSMLQSAELLKNGVAHWVIRAHKNKVFEGRTDTGEPFFVDANDELIQLRNDLSFGLDDAVYTNMHLIITVVDKKYLIYTGTLPEGTYEETINLTIENNTYDKFFQTIAANLEIRAHADYNLQVLMQDDGTYILHSSNPVTFSGNVVGEQSSLISNNLELKFASGDFYQQHYFMLNDKAYYNEGVGVNPYEYPGVQVPLGFRIPNSLQNSARWSVYLLDKLIGDSSVRKLISANYFDYAKTIVGTVSGTPVELVITTNISEDYLTIDGGKIIVNPLMEALPAKQYILLQFGSVGKCLVHTGLTASEITALGVSADDDLISLINCYSPYRLVEAILEDEVAIETKFDTMSVAITDNTTKYLFNVNISRANSYGYLLPTGSTFSVKPVVDTYLLDAVNNTNNNIIDNASIQIDGTEYISGTQVPELPTVVILSESPVTLKEFVELLSVALPMNMNTAFSDNTLQLFRTSTELLTFVTKGDITCNVLEFNYQNVVEDNQFGVVLAYNSRAKVASFSYTYDEATRLITIDVDVNGKQYSRVIEFFDSTKVDGYGVPLWYDMFNENFDLLKIIAFDGAMTLSSYNCPSFGNTLLIPPSTSMDVQEALNQLVDMKFTKFEITSTAGWESAAYVSVFADICQKLKAIAYNSLPETLKDVADLVAHRNTLPNTWNVSTYVPYIRTADLGDFVTQISPACQKIIKIVRNKAQGKEFQGDFGASEGVITGRPKYNFTTVERETLLGSQINSVFYTKELSLSYFNNNLTMQTLDNPMSEDCIVRMANASHHVAELYLDMYVTSKKNVLKTRNTVVADLDKYISQRLTGGSGEKPYRKLTIICDESNNTDGSRKLTVSCKLDVSESIKDIELFTIVRNVAE